MSTRRNEEAVVVSQCPKCELRFAVADELDDHLARDHGVRRDALPDRPRPGAFRRDDREALANPPPTRR